MIGASAAVLNLVFNYFLIRRYGMMGAAWATVLSFAFIAGVSYWRSQCAFRLPLGVGRVLVGMVLAAGMYLPCRYWAPSALWLTLTMKLLALVVFGVLILKGGILPPGGAETLLAGRTQAFSRILRFAGLGDSRSAS